MRLKVGIGRESRGEVLIQGYVAGERRQATYLGRVHKPRRRDDLHEISEKGQGSAGFKVFSRLRGMAPQSSEEQTGRDSISKQREKNDTFLSVISEKEGGKREQNYSLGKTTPMKKGGKKKESLKQRR